MLIRMKIAITGSPQAGQQQLFSLLTGISMELIQQKPLEAQVGICEVKDPRVTRLSEMYHPKKTTHARIEYLLLPDFNLQGPARELIMGQLKNADELCWVLRAENVESEISSFLAELVIADLMLVEKRLENIARDQRKKYLETREKEKALVETCHQLLEQGKLLQKVSFSDEQVKMLRTYQCLTMKPIILALNVPEKEINDFSYAQKIKEKFDLPLVQLSAELEEEISRLGEEDRETFLKEMGIDEPALHKMTRTAYAGLGLISFFTVGEDEVRAWTVRRGAFAPEAGSVIHSDIEKGFVRAEMMKYEDLIAAGTEAKLKEQGKFYIKGKEYVVEDGDILSFRFNV